jgi:nitroreductase
MQLIENLKWRYATKKFDTGKKVSVKNLKKIQEAVKFSASSYGLQLYKVLFVEDLVIREKLKPASWNQPQITDASHLVVFCNYVNLNENHIDEFIDLKAAASGMKPEALKGYGDFMKNAVITRGSEINNHWTSKQTYIALGNLLAASAELKIDACPMEGFSPEQYNEILGLTEKGLNASVIATIGYRSNEDETQHYPKFRRSNEQLFELL